MDIVHSLTAQKARARQVHQSFTSNSIRAFKIPVFLRENDCARRTVYLLCPNHTQQKLKRSLLSRFRADPAHCLLRGTIVNRTKYC